MANREVLHIWCDVEGAEELVEALNAAIVFFKMRGVQWAPVTIAPLLAGAPYPDEAEVCGVAAVREPSLAEAEGAPPVHSIQLMLAGC